MELLHTLKFGFNRSPLLSGALIHLQEISLLGLVAAAEYSSFYSTFFEIFTYQENSNQYLLLTMLSINIIKTLLLVLIFIFKVERLRWVLPGLSVFFKIFPYALSVATFNYCFSTAVNNQQWVCSLAAVANLPFLLGYLLLHQFINESLKFREVDHCNRRVVSYTGALLLPTAILILQILGPLYAALCCCLRAGYQLLGLYSVCEYVLPQKLKTFYALFTFYFSFIIFLTNFSNLIDQETLEVPLVNLVIMAGGMGVSWMLSGEVVALIWRHMLRQARGSGERSDGQSDPTQQRPLNRIENQLKILVQAFLERQRSSQRKPNNYSYFWRQFSEIVYQHKLKCEAPRCLCKSKGNKDEDEIDTQLYVENLLKRVLSASEMLGKEMRLKVINIYLLIQIAKRPLKGYYQLILLKKEKTRARLQLQIDDLISISRECFDQIFYKNKVQNQQLDLLRVVHSEQTIRSLEDQLKQALIASSAFLEIFTYSTLKMAQVQSQAQRLNTMKRQIEAKIQSLAVDCSQNPSVSFAIFVFYRYLDTYRSREAEFKKAAGQQALKKRLLLKADGQNISEYHGIIHIDLVEERGRIKKITRNISDFFGYAREDMVGFNINLFMPTIYGKNHAKFLSNFIDKGRIRLLKERLRVVFGKNKKKFIFPLNARLKAQHLLDNEFGASALLSNIDTNSDFMIVGKNGRIEEISETLYRRIFGQTLRDQVHKASRFCAYKILPGLNQVLEGWEEKQASKIYEGLAIYPEQQDYLFQKFRHNPDSAIASVSKSKDSTMSLVSNSEDQMPMTSKSEKYQYFTQLFKTFLSDINPKRLKAFKVSYKYSIVKTSQFEVQVIEIIASKEQLHGKQFMRELLNQLNNVAEIFQLLEQQSPLAQHLLRLEEQIDLEQDYKTQRDFKTMELNLDTKQFHQQNHHHVPDEGSKSLRDSEEQFVQEVQENELMHHKSSERNSVSGSIENQSKKQLLINAFNTSQDVIPASAIACAVLAVIALLALLLSMSLIQLQSIQTVNLLWTDSMYLLSLRLTFEFRVGLAQLNRFANNINIPMPAGLLQQQVQLNLKMVSLAQSLIESTYNTALQNSPFAFYTPLFDPNLQVTYNATFPQAVMQLNQLFSEQTQANNNTLRYNYQGIHQNLSDFYQLRYNFYTQQSNTLQQLMTGLLAVYEVLIGLVALSSIPIFLYFKKQELAVRSKLAFMSQRQIKKSVGRLALVQEYFKHAIAKSSVNRLQMDLIERKFQKEQEANGSKIIKITSQSQQYKVFSNPWMYCLLLAFIVFFSNLSVGLYTIFEQSNTFFLNALDSHKLINDLQIKTPLLINVYMSNLNRVLQGSPLWNFQTKTVSQTQTGYFSLISTLSLPQYNSSTIAQTLNNDSTSSICLMISCQNSSNLSLQDIAQSFKHRFDYWNPSNGITPSQQTINSWLSDNSIQSVLTEVGEVLALALVAQNQINSQFTNKTNWLWSLAVLLSCLLMPINLIGLGVILRKYLVEVNQMVRSAQELFMHFPVPVLVQNTYLTSYFTSKIKAGK